MIDPGTSHAASPRPDRLVEPARSDGPASALRPGRPAARRRRATRSCPARGSLERAPRRAARRGPRRLRRRRRPARRSLVAARPAPGSALRRGSGGRDRASCCSRHGGQLADGRRRALGAGRHARSPASSARSGPGIGIRVRAEGRAIARRRGARRADARPCWRSARTAARAAARASSCGRAASTSAWPGTILVVGSRIDAEALTRARAMGVRGVVVAGLAGKERRDFLASEARQRAALHRLPPFAVLVLDGAIRRPIAEPDRRRSSRRSPAARSRSSTDPPALVFDEPERRARRRRARSRPGPGRRARRREGRWAGLAGLRRFAGGTFLEAGWVRFGGDRPRRRSRSPTSSASPEPSRLPGRRMPLPSAHARLRSPSNVRSPPPTPAETRRLGARLGRGRRAGRPRLPVGRARRRQDAVREGLRRGPRRRPTRSTRRRFVLMAEYAGRLPLFHVDLYRLADAADALAGGLIDERQATGVTLVEWPDRLGDAAAGRAGSTSRIDGTGDEPRRITLRTSDRRPRALRGRGACAGARGRPGGRRVTALDGRAGSSRSTRRRAAIVAAAARSDGRARRRRRLGGRLPPRRGRSCPRLGRCSASAASRSRTSAASSSGPGRARSRGCGSGSRRPRRSPTSSACRSSASRPARPCSPAAADAAGRERLVAPAAGRPERPPSSSAATGPRSCCPAAPSRPSTSGEIARRGRPRRSRARPTRSPAASAARDGPRRRAPPDRGGAARRRRRRRPGAPRPGVRHAAARRRAPRAGRSHGRATPGEGR